MCSQEKLGLVTLPWTGWMYRIRLLLHVHNYTTFWPNHFYIWLHVFCALPSPLICVILNCKGDFIVIVQTSKMSNDKSNNYSLIPEQFQGQFIRLAWNAICSITQSKKTGETIHQIPKCVCMCMHAYALIWPQHIGTKPSRGAWTDWSLKKDQRALVTQRVSSQLLKENHLL